MTETIEQIISEKIEFKKDNVSVFVGKNAGKELDENLQKAQSSITIVSPYMSEEKIDDLLYLSKKGVKIDIYLSEDKGIEQDNKTQNVLRKLIKQNEHEDKENLKKYKQDLKQFNLLKKKKQKRAKFIYLPLLILVGFFLYLLLSDVLAPFIKQNYKSIFNFISSNWVILVFVDGVIGIALLKALFDTVYSSKDTIEYKPRYYYTYSFVNDNIKVYYTLKNKTALLHAKYYIIDNKVVYTGSLNFTHNGFKNNLETCIKFEDEDFAKKITHYTNNIYSSGCGFYYHNSLKSYNSNKSLGHIIYNSDNI